MHTEETSWQDISDIAVQLQQEMMEALDECIQAEQRLKAASEGYEQAQRTYQHRKQRWMEAGAVDNRHFWDEMAKRHNGNAPQAHSEARRMAS